MECHLPFRLTRRMCKVLRCCRIRPGTSSTGGTGAAGVDEDDGESTCFCTGSLDDPRRPPLITCRTKNIETDVLQPWLAL